MSPQNGLRQQKKLATKQALVREAHRLFAEKGYEATTFDDIAAATDISRRTVFRYFPTKEAIVFSDHDVILGGFLKALAAAPLHASPLEKLQQAFIVLSQTMERNKGDLLAKRHLVLQSTALMAYELNLDRQWQKATARALDPDCVDGEQPNFEARVLAGAMIGGLRSVVQIWEESGGKKDLTNMGLVALDLINDGGSKGSTLDDQP